MAGDGKVAQHGATNTQSVRRVGGAATQHDAGTQAQRDASAQAHRVVNASRRTTDERTTDPAAPATYGAPLDDAHCHVAFMADPVAFARDAAAAGSRVLAASVTPGEFVSLRAKLQAARSSQPDARDAARTQDDTAPSCALRQAVGLHPWWVGNDVSAQLAAFDELASATRFVAEVGLDFAPRHVATKHEQRRAFAHIARACAAAGDKVLSVHSVRAATAALDVLEDAGCFDACAVIFHWFSGTSDELQRAIAAGCFFSVGERMLATKRGRAYVAAIPAGRLLLETDAPYGPAPEPGGAGVPYTFAEVFSELVRTLCRIAEARRCGASELAEAIHANGETLWGSAPSSQRTPPAR